MQNRYTDGSYTSLNSDFNDSESLSKANSFSSFLSKNTLSPNSLLDFGCGGGGVLRSLSIPSLKTAIGFDINPDAIAYANSLNKSLLVSFTSDNPISKDISFDCISLIHVLEHVDNWLDLLLSLAKSSKYIYISIPLEASIWHSIRSNTLKAQYIRYGHIHFFNKNYFLHRISEHGFNIIDVDYSDEFRAFSSFKSKLITLPRLFLGLFSKSLSANLLGGYCLQVLVKTKL